MSSKRPAAPAPLTKATDDKFITIQKTFSVVTPVFGGGVRINENASHKKPIDPVTPVRGASVRGQLRFWWRATHGCTLGSIEEMREHESSRWGAASTPGRISLTVTPDGEAKPPSPVVVYELKDNGRANPKSGMRVIAYGAFPLQPSSDTEDAQPGALAAISTSYIVALRAPRELQGEAEDALTAWLFFGCVGGRGRRGFGSVHGSRLLLDPQEFLRKFTATKTLAGVPSLHGAQLELKSAGATADAAWKIALGKLQTFRQAENVGRNPGQQSMRPGRSRWPEPELIRKMTGRRMPLHQPIPGPQKAPRAMFGLPIIVHFKDEKQGEPRTTKFVPLPLGDLRHSQQDRMASPLIIKPVHSQGSWHAACLLLADSGRANMSVEFEDDTKRNRTVEWRLTDDDADQIKPLAGRGSDVLLAFLEFFAE